MFDVAVKFENFFWKIYEDDKKYQESEDKFKFLKKKCMPSRAGKTTNQPRRTKRLELLNEIDDLAQETV